MSEQDTSDPLEERIEAAQQSGNTAEANRLYQLQIGSTPHGDEAVAPGAEGEADSAGDESLPAETATPPPLSAELVDQVLGACGDEDAGEVAELRRDWPGAELGANLGYVKWFLEEYVSPDMIDQLPDDIASLRVGAAMARELFHRHHLDAGARSAGAKNMSEANDDAFDEKTDALMDEQAEAHAAGNLGKANRLEREIRAMFVKRFGTGPVVGSGGRNA